MTEGAAGVAASPLLGVYKPPAPVFVRGHGCELIAEDGTSYLDFTSGIGVNALGYGSAELRAAVEAALAVGILHTSNLFRTRPGEALAAQLVAAAFPSQVFFCNSGAEANEAAFKFARRWARAAGGEAKHEIVAFQGSFHGRLFGALAATDRPAMRAPFEPLMPGVHFATIGDLEGVERILAGRTVAGVIIEPVQGEGGVKPVPANFLRGLRRLCDEQEAALIFDEVQCGLGRTGTLFAYQALDVTPDVLTLAKPLAGGLPMGATLVGERIAAAVQPGDHATTFGGGPFVASVALAVLERLSDPGFLAEVRSKGEWLGGRLAVLGATHAVVRDVRGLGLMWGLELEGAAAPIVNAALERGLLLTSAGQNVLRLLPPLTIRREELERGLGILEQVLE
ncbi:MAG: acetylornithine transaminase [Gemmatimonadetes bacterium]|nr:acetylornithine transaminase [Gemmatimonadota bacterium]